jgi:hypothetical protein
MQSFARSLSLTATLMIAVIVGLLLAAAPQEKQPPARGMTLAPAPPRGKSDAPPPAPITFADPDGQELILEDLSARTAIHGMLSLTELELRFRNPQSRRIEGRFTCTLPPNAAISRFAKEVNGQLMEGEVVERLRANQVYEQFLHQMRDPALLEQDQGNRFSARIFPIEANAPVRLVLSYTTLLPLRDGVRTYTLPLRGMSKVNKLTFRAFVTPIPAQATAGQLTTSTAEVTSFDQQRLDAGPRHRAHVAPDSPRRLCSCAPAISTSPRCDRMSLHGAQTSGRPPQLAVLRRHLGILGRGRAASHPGARGDCSPRCPPATTCSSWPSTTKSSRSRSGTASELSRSAGDLLRARLFLGGTDLGAMLRDLTRAPRDRRAPSSSPAISSPPSGRRLARAAGRDRRLPANMPACTRSSSAAAKTRRPRRRSPPRRGRVVRVPFTDALAITRRRGRRGAAPSARRLGRCRRRRRGMALSDAFRRRCRRRRSARPRQSESGRRAAHRVDCATRLDAATFAPLLEREAYRAYLEYLAEREANETSDAVRRALAAEQVKISIEQRVVIPRTTMLVLESEWDYQRFGLDRRALAQILTIDAGGIGRSTAPRTFTPPPMPMTMRRRAAPASQIVRRGRESAAATGPQDACLRTAGAGRCRWPGGVEGGVEGGVVGGGRRCRWCGGGVVGEHVRQVAQTRRRSTRFVARNSHQLLPRSAGPRRRKLRRRRRARACAAAPRLRAPPIAVLVASCRVKPQGCAVDATSEAVARADRGARGEAARGPARPRAVQPAQRNARGVREWSALRRWRCAGSRTIRRTRRSTKSSASPPMSWAMRPRPRVRSRR